MALPPAGWYLDPQSATAMRWWSGDEWTEHLQPVVADPKPEAYVPMAGGRSAVGAPALQFTGRARRVENERQARRNNVFAWLGLLFGVISFLFNPLALLSIVAVVFASIGLARAQRLRDAGDQFTGRGTAIAGLIVGLIGIALVGVYLATGRLTF